MSHPLTKKQEKADRLQPGKPGSEPFLGRLIWPNIPSGRKQAETRDRRQETGCSRKSSQESYQGPDRGPWHRDGDPKVADVSMAVGMGGSVVKQGPSSAEMEKANMTLREVQPGGWEEGKNGGGGGVEPKRRSDCSGEGKAGKRA